MTTALATPTAPAIDASLIERVLIHGDLRQLTPAQKVSYYNAVCTSVGLNPLTQPFQYLVLNGKEILYALRSATEQLRRIHSVSIQIVAREVTEDCYVVTARATLPSGRQDENIGAVPIAGLKGEHRANAMMKAETKAKRRVTLAICGLGMLDETEVESITPPAVGPPTAVLEAADRASGAIDTTTGEEFPAGFALIDDYKPDGDWHHVTWGRDAQGGWTVYKTKLAKVANKARVAFNDRVPVKLHSKKFPFLDAVERLDDDMTPAQIKATKWTPAPAEPNKDMGF